MAGADAKHRLFFALQPDAETLDAIVSIQRRLGRGMGRAVPAGRIHATLLFMGNQTDSGLYRLTEIASNLEFPACNLSLDRCGHFPRAEVAWLGPSHVPSELQDFQVRLSAAVASAGIDFDEKAWRMHLTLYRDLRMRPGRIDFEPVEWPLRNFQLMESINRGSGLEYHCRGRWPAPPRA